jgi:hypothetical protein
MLAHECPEELPPNLSISELTGQCLYRDPVTRRTKDLGYDRSAAVDIAKRMNVGKGTRRKPDPRRRVVRMAAFVQSQDLISEEEILKLATPVKQLCGIYLLIREGKVVYVGQSTNCHARIGTHFYERGKKFDAFHLIECGTKQLKKLEAQYIAKFMPQYNVLVPMVSEPIAA